MANEEEPFFNWELDKVDNRNDLIRLVLSILASIKLVTAALGYRFFSDDLMVAIANLIPLLIILWGVVKPNFIGKKGKAQKLILAKHNLIDEENVIKDEKVDE